MLVSSAWRCTCAPPVDGGYAVMAHEDVAGDERARGARPSTLWFSVHRTVAALAARAPTSCVAAPPPELPRPGRGTHRLAVRAPVERRVLWTSCDWEASHRRTPSGFRVVLTCGWYRATPTSRTTSSGWGSIATRRASPSWWATPGRARTERRSSSARTSGSTPCVGASAATSRPYTAVEPNPMSSAALRRNLDAERPRPRATSSRRRWSGLASRRPSPSGSRTETSTGASAGRVRRRRRRPRRRRGAVGDRACVRGDDLVDGVDLLKLDIEGLEVEVLSSVRPVDLVRRRPRSWSRSGTTPTHLQRLIAELVDDAGYSCAAVVDGERPAAPARRGVGRPVAGALPARATSPCIAPARLDHLLAETR